MSTDSTELTFVRCSSCRSLVPAVSTRCRMCGAALDSASEESAEPDDKSSRVRQRTMSKPKSQLSSAVQQLREELDEDEPNTSSHSSTSGTSESSVDTDPLGFASEPTAADASSSDQSLLSQPAAKPAYGAGQIGAPEDSPEETPVIDDPLSAYIQEVEEENKAPVVKVAAPEKPKMQAKPAPDLKREPKREPAVPPKPEAGPTFRQSAPSKPVPEQKPIPESPPIQAAARSAEAARVDSSSTESGSADVEDQRSSSKSKARRNRRRRAKKRSTQAEAGAENVAPMRRAGERPEGGIKVVPGAGKKGRLFGWLVSYENAEGDATELREGKFFVTQESLKESDLVLNDPSISTPHAMVSVSMDRGVVVQDLMSDGGVLVRERGTEEYKREEEPVQIFHGDWIRFGEVEFLVTLIAHVGEK